uniref:Uncharacterized protein n=1 Tax=Arundo donax TaxID=35708 RepID=A0A0A9BXS3_ARUDO
MFPDSCVLTSCIPNTCLSSFPVFFNPLFCHYVPILFMYFSPFLCFIFLRSKQALVNA